jgi:3-oxoacyl-[acyl-carrier-protein] synthase II
MEFFINGTGCISPQLSFDNQVFLPEIRSYSKNNLHCIDPDYSSFFDPANVRRMSRVIKFATAAAFLALRDAELKVPGAISIGTGFGLLENSSKFLNSIIENDEGVVSPTAFIQSTHNTIGGIVAQMTGCHAHNNTFTQKSVSFECALNDAVMLMKEGDTDNFLVGGFDELTAYALEVMTNRHALRQEPCNNLELFSSNNNGIIAGEGAAFFVLAKEKNTNTYGRLLGNNFFIKPETTKDLKGKITAFLEKNNMAVNMLDVVICGLCGDAEKEAVATELNESLFSNQTIVVYKHLCGEYMTSSSFALWLAAKMIKTGQIPATVALINRNREPKNVLLINSVNDYHSLILLGAC